MRHSPSSGILLLIGLFFSLLISEARCGTVLMSKGNSNSLSQSIDSLVVGNPYTISFEYHVISATSESCRIEVFLEGDNFGNTDYFSKTFIIGAAWGTFSANFIATATTETLQLNATCSTGTSQVYVISDNVIKAVSASSSVIAKTADLTTVPINTTPDSTMGNPTAGWTDTLAVTQTTAVFDSGIFRPATTETSTGGRITTQFDSHSLTGTVTNAANTQNSLSSETTFKTQTTVASTSDYLSQTSTVERNPTSSSVPHVPGRCGYRSRKF